MIPKRAFKPLPVGKFGIKAREGGYGKERRRNRGNG